ncbi:MAG: hypothetical protein IJB74_08315 [Clostridia bacterium]|nr:hypothetical protein [Clostridia bacterium]
MKKLLSFLLAVIMVLSVMPVAFASDGYKCNCGVTPIIYIKGRTNIYKDRYAEPTSENMAETNLTGGTDAIVESALNIVASLGAALITDEWDEYCDVLLDEVTPIYEGYKLNNDGEKGEGNITGIHHLWDVDQIIAGYREVSKVREGHTVNATYWPQYMQFQYDMRLDPRENAKDLKKLIDATKELTGHDKINIICRCEGNVIVNAYLNMYKEEAKKEIEGLVMYNSISNGAEIADELYSNKFDLNADAMNRFISGFLDTSPVLDLVKETVNVLTYAGVLDEGLGFIEGIYDKICLNLMPRLIREIFGTCPGWWGMVSPEAFEDAKAFVLETDNADGKYDKLIEKLDAYNEYKKNAGGILKEMQDSGVKVHIIAKYGEQIYPVIDNADLLGDGVVSLKKQTFNGATTSKIDTTLDKDYIAERIEKGFGDYISADEKVDASTALFPEHTWYIKNLPHDNYPWVMETFMADLLNYDGYANVDSFGDKYTMFMNFTATDDKPHGYDNGILSPLTEENKDDSAFDTDTSSIFTVLIKFLTALIKFFTSLLVK